MEIFEQTLAQLSDSNISALDRGRLSRNLEALKDQYDGDTVLKINLIKSGIAKKDLNLTFFAMNYLFSSNATPSEAALADQKSIIIDLLAALPTSAMHFTSAEYRILAEKVVSAATSLAKAEWPARWPELFPQVLSGVAESAVFSAEEVATGELSSQTRRLVLGLMLLRSISEDVRVYYDPKLSERRKGEIVAGLKGQGSTIVSYVVSILRSNTQHLMTAGTAHRNVFLLCLDTLSAYIDWVSLKVVTDSEMPLILTQIQSVEWLKQKATDVALLLVNRQIDPNDIGYLEALWFPLCPPFFSDFAAAAQTSAQNCVQQGTVMSAQAAAAYNHFVRLTEVFCVAGCKLIDALNADATSRHTAVPETMTQYLQLIVSLFSHPSLEISALAYPPLTSCFRNREKLGGTAAGFFTDEVVVMLCNATVEKLNSGCTNGYYSRGDESIERAQLSLINNFSSFIYKLNKEIPFEFSLRKMAALVGAMNESNVEQVLNSGEMKFFCCTLKEAAVSGLPSSRCLGLFLEFIQGIIKIPYNIKIILAQLKFLKKSFKLIKSTIHNNENYAQDWKELISNLFTVIFEAYKTHASQFPVCTTQDEKIVRYYIFDTLISFSKHFNSELSSLVFDGFFTWYVSSQESINVHDRTQFVDILTLIASADAGKQVTVSERLLAPVAAQISQFISWSGDSTSLWRFVCAKADYDILYTNLAIISSCFRRLIVPIWSSQELVSNVVKPTLEVILNLIESTHKILSPHLRRAAIIDNSVLTEVETVYAAQNIGQKDPRRSALFNLLESLYVIVGKIFESAGIFSSVPGLLEIFTGRIISTLPFSANYDAVNMFLFRVIGPLAARVGDANTSAMLLPAQKVAIGTFMNMSWDALQRDWAPLVKDADLIRLVSGNNPEDSNEPESADASDENSEIKKDASLRSFSRKFFEWILNDILKNYDDGIRGDIEMTRFVAAVAVKSMGFPDSRMIMMSHLILLKLFTFFPLKQGQKIQQGQNIGELALTDERYVWASLEILEGITNIFLNKQPNSWQPQANLVEIMLYLFVFTAPVQSGVVQKITAIVPSFDSAKYAKCMSGILAPKSLKKAQLSKTREIIRDIISNNKTNDPNRQEGRDVVQEVSKELMRLILSANIKTKKKYN